MTQSTTITGKDGVFELRDYRGEPKGVLGSLKFEEQVKKSKRDIRLLNQIVLSGSIRAGEEIAGWRLVMTELETLGVDENIACLFKFGGVQLSIIERLKQLSYETRKAHYGNIAWAIATLISKWEAEQENDLAKANRLGNKLLEIGYSLGVSKYETEIVAGSRQAFDPDNIVRAEEKEQRRTKIREAALEVMSSAPNRTYTIRMLAKILHDKNLVSSFASARRYLSAPSIVDEFKTLK